MNILVFADHHGSISILKKIKQKAKDADLIICLGDFTIFSNNIEEILFNINNLGKPVLLITGNHEEAEEVEMICEELPNIVFAHKKAKRIGDYVFLAYGDSGLSVRNKDMDNFFKKAIKKLKKEKIILLTHGPPFGTKLDRLGKHHCGCQTTSEFIEKNKNIVIALSGHFHETFGKEDKIGKTKLINPGPYGKIIKI